MTIDIDPLATAGLTARQVRTGERDGRATRVVIARRAYDSDHDDLWDALTNPERLPRWFLPVTGDLQVGGRYQVVGNAGGIVERCEPPRSFSVTWEMGPTVSWLTITLTEDDGRTTLELSHEAPVDPDFWTQFGPGAVGVGWDLGLMGLGLHLSSGADNDGAEAQAWTLSPDGVAFVRASAEDWAAAATADGDDAAAAQDAAERTITFYTVMPEGGDGSAS